MSYHMNLKAKSKFYAVRCGREGPQIYKDFSQFKAATSNFSGSSGKGFDTHNEAMEWLHIGFNLTNHLMPSVISIPTNEPQLPDPQASHSESYRRLSTMQKPASNLHALDIATTLPAPMQDVRLSPEQNRVLNLVKSGSNVFFTGPAGTGKSVLLREIIKYFRTLPDHGLAITASTGIAGLNIGGSTVHSFAGIGLGKEPKERLAMRICGSLLASQRWKSTDTLIIDEISMLDGVLFDKLEYIARVVRKRREPFGGIQLVLSGDFCQLPPVPDQTNKVHLPTTFAFDAKTWDKCIAAPIVLHQVFRQKDNEFVEMLSAIRVGQLTAKHIAKLLELSRPLIYADGVEPSQLFALRSEVERCNRQRLDALPGEVYSYESMDSRGYDVNCNLLTEKEASALLDRMIALQKIDVKVGAQVMLIKNMIRGVLVNGSVGKVVEFITTSEALERHIAIAQPDNKKDDEQDKRPSRATEDLARGLAPMSNIVFGRKQKWPLVEFVGGILLLCAPVSFTVEGFLGNIEAHRLQVPLILAWALSIHKSQGQTLTRVKVDLGRIFENGQAYVALSRATTMESLEVANFHPSKVKVHPRVLSWQNTWMSTEESRDTDDEMDCEEAISRHWDLSEWTDSLESPSA